MCSCDHGNNIFSFCRCPLETMLLLWGSVGYLGKGNHEVWMMEEGEGVTASSIRIVACLTTTWEN